MVCLCVEGRHVVNCPHLSHLNFPNNRTGFSEVHSTAPQRLREQ